MLSINQKGHYTAESDASICLLASIRQHAPDTRVAQHGTALDLIPASKGRPNTTASQASNAQKVPRKEAQQRHRR